MLWYWWQDNGVCWLNLNTKTHAFLIVCWPKAFQYVQTNSDIPHYGSLIKHNNDLSFPFHFWGSSQTGQMPIEEKLITRHTGQFFNGCAFRGIYWVCPALDDSVLVNTWAQIHVISAYKRPPVLSAWTALAASQLKHIQRTLWAANMWVAFQRD